MHVHKSFVQSCLRDLVGELDGNFPCSSLGYSGSKSPPSAITLFEKWLLSSGGDGELLQFLKDNGSAP